VEVLHGVRPSQPPRPRVMRGLAARLNSKRSQGRPWAGYRAAKRVEFRGADAVPLAGKQNPPRANGLRMRNLALSETPCTWRRPLYGNWEISPVSGEAHRTGS
jgi:hypothetical protein